MIDNSFNPKEYKILTRKGCIKQGINPDDEANCWSNNGEVSCAEEYKQYQGDLNEVSYEKAKDAYYTSYDNMVNNII